ncbi:MAG: hypothetical protein A2275_00235 [Bacteroidetes bacterium RIFOXYA12_FULL_35_11]|nr:MAG: hypothetical protein A2X01_20610 [Bacteroidetes bacterium GWF2_35_48]OFY83572.1 MAG: hypothetical protein A2275_00235 [Bacteroidetes bacterium RIFOXYA12_FULL_35_11]OFY93996.1 MAG: hypothetical protein A2491_16905 [Bacteroidetes bacterium RIFOXYC12_FULL_35_7]OFY97559.1 MAG: hypothetical protein A2309_12755 [Bacteroidetes bacterium RIFOXYB2_FULL_35_7]HBX51766.1 hypothetical protein [Bacteroidales bacterium]
MVIVIIVAGCRLQVAGCRLVIVVAGLSAGFDSVQSAAENLQQHDTSHHTTCNLQPATNLFFFSLIPIKTLHF